MVVTACSLPARSCASCPDRQVCGTGSPSVSVPFNLKSDKRVYRRHEPSIHLDLARPWPQYRPRIRVSDLWQSRKALPVTPLQLPAVLGTTHPARGF